MSAKIEVDGAFALGSGVWLLELPPEEIGAFKEIGICDGSRSILAIDDCVFSEATGKLRFSVASALLLSKGQGSKVVAVDRNYAASMPIPIFESEASQKVLVGKGDSEFLSMAHRLLSGEMAEAAQKLLEGVRARSEGDLKRGLRRNFSNTPDNFWYVIVQPQADALSITVRGAVTHFDHTARLELKDDRGNTRFKVSSTKDVPEALKLIFRAKRRI